MGLFSGTPKGTDAAELKKLHEQYKPLLIDGEIIEVKFTVTRDTFLFTNKRLILANVQGIAGRTVEYLTIPYGNITKFSIHTGEGFDLDAELLIWIGGETIPIEKKFNRDANIYELQKVLAHHVLNAP